MNKRLLNKLKPVAQEVFTGRNWKALAQALNDRGILTDSGRPWTLANLRNWTVRNHIVLPLQTQANKDQVTALHEAPGPSVCQDHAKDDKQHSREKKSAQDASHSLTMDDIAIIKAMIQAYKNTQGRPDKEHTLYVGVRPRIQHGEKRISVRLNPALYETCMKKLEAEQFKQGQSFSGLVEYLLWLYAGSPSDLCK
jgi:hypothetical protein